MKEWSYLNSAVQILQAYNGQEPFASFSRKYFSQHKKYGSKDRKQISHLCYCYFRLGKSAMDLTVEERLMAGLFLCNNGPNEMLDKLKPDWNANALLSAKEKCSMLNVQCSILDVFPWKEELSEGIEYENFCGSFFIQPDLFFRLRPGKDRIVKQKLQEAGIEYKMIKDDCIALSNSSKLDKVIELNKEAVVQDYNSQRVGEFLVTGQTGTVRPDLKDNNSQRVGELPSLPIANCPLSVWDCCAASGGKSIMAKDILGDIDLTVSDIRESILINLKQRFKEAGIKNYRSFMADLALDSSEIRNLKSDIIIADAPCTGSGTWSRTPEQLYYFNRNEIDRYSFLQKKIVSNAIPHLLAGGYFLYITCSVFTKENEEVVEFIKKNFQLNLIKMEILKGYDKKADTMFAALFRKLL